ncbi:Ribosomal small subunit pseudouridine synthase A [bioreactor metagenome]|uniref:Ribosomal small subunit pseudouridine synthase A n=1 Tax=bioreactor metagenome TaxID=1076179 RepID=A0A645GEC8_9ZZZZ
MLNKPRGYVCTNADPHAPRKAVDLIRLDSPVRLFSAGRLDKESEGMILFSNDGDYVAQLTHPRHEILKTYLVRVVRELTSAELERIRAGIREDGELLRVVSIDPLGKCRYRIVLNEGKKREIRRLTAAVGAATLELRRVRIGGLELGDLPEGAFRELSPEEVALTLTPHC